MLSLELVMNKDVPGQNRGFAFVDFYNTACANHAKAVLGPPYMCAPSPFRASQMYMRAQVQANTPVS